VLATRLGTARQRGLAQRQSRPTMRPNFVLFKRIITRRRCCMHTRSRTLPGEDDRSLPAL
jgi:hypothetical protein